MAKYMERILTAPDAPANTRAHTQILEHHRHTQLHIPLNSTESTLKKKKSF